MSFQTDRRETIPNFLRATDMSRLVARRPAGQVAGKRRGAWWSLVVSTVPALILASLPAVEARGYTTKSPEVRAIVDKAVGYLETAKHNELGGKCLVALGILKAPLAYDPALKDHPRVQEAIEACKTAAERRPFESAIYSLAIAIIFLCELDDPEYDDEIRTLMDELLKVQKEHGGWGYHDKQTGDTSQTQYGVLCCWYAMKKRGLDLDPDVIERVSDWLIRTQDESGAWGYQGVIDSRQQRLTSLSLTSAAAGSLYICADMLDIRFASRADAQTGPNTALVEVKSEEEQQQRGGGGGGRVTTARLRPVLDRGDGWMNGNFNITQERWKYYYLYALERHMSFRDLGYGRQPEESDWYNQGVEFMKKEQDEKGFFSSDSGPACSTAFAVLFLTRSTQRSIGRIEPAETTLRGGRDLSADVANVRENAEGQVIVPKVVTDITKLVDALNDPNFAVDEEAIRQVMEVPMDKVARDQDAVRLRKMVSAENYAARLFAVRALVKARDLEHVPLLIYALGDPSDEIKREARDGLRFLSRKFDGFSMPANPNEREVEAAKNSWKQWYLSIRPEGQFLD